MPELPPPPAGADVDPWRAVTRWVEARRASLRPVITAVAAVAAVVVLGAIAWMSLRQETGPPVELTLPRAGGGGDATGADAGGADRDGPPAPIVVHVAGAVARPGVYRLAAEARLADAIDAAGGPLADADPDAVNLAAKLNDGERIYLPRRGESVPPLLETGSGDDGAGKRPALLDLNTATADQLEELPGVGPSTASAILEYRKERGRFRSVDELLEVRGIGPSKFAALRSKVTVR